MKKYNLEINDKKAKKIMKIFLNIAFFICLLGTLMLWIYHTHYISIHLFKASIIIFRTGLLTGIFSIICGIFFCNYVNT